MNITTNGEYHEITLRKLYDLHVHLRNGEMLRNVLPFTTLYCAYATVMPNTRPLEVLSGDDAVRYRSEIVSALGDLGLGGTFTPLMTIEIRDGTTPAMIEEAKLRGVVAGKAYPLGVTTNSDKGLRKFRSARASDTFAAMEACGMLLLIHGELSGDRVLVTERESNFLSTLEWLSDEFPELKIVLEHVTTEDAIELVAMLPERVAATITAHHLCMTLNDVIGDGIRPHNGCMPMPKRFEDRDALLSAATSGNPKFFLGSDSAPHPREKKECAHAACGVFSAPLLPALLAEVFERAEALPALEDFTSTFGARFYGLPLAKETLTLRRKPWNVPSICGNVVPFKAGETLAWQLA